MAFSKDLKRRIVLALTSESVAAEFETIIENAAAPAAAPSFVNNKSLLFDGIDGKLIVAHDASIHPSSQITVGFWFKANSFGPNDGLVVKTSSGAWTDGYGLYYGSGLLKFWVGHYSNNQANITAPTDGLWHHVVGVYDGAQVRIYLDAVAGNVDTYAGSITANTSNIEIGHAPAGGYFDGHMDEVFISNVGLSALEVLAIYNAGVPNDISGTTGIVSHWRMGDGDTYPGILDNVGSNLASMVNMAPGDITTDTP